MECITRVPHVCATETSFMGGRGEITFRGQCQPCGLTPVHGSERESEGSECIWTSLVTMSFTKGRFGEGDNQPPVSEGACGNQGLTPAIRAQ